MKEETKEYGLTEYIKDLEALDARTLGIYNASLLTALMYGLLGEETAKEYINDIILKEIKGIAEE